MAVERLVRELEELSFRTLPAIEQERYDGWVLRWSDGGSRRGNSVNPVRSSTLPLDEKVAHCEDWFAKRGALCVFRLTELADTGLEGILLDRGYQVTSPTDVMVAEIGDVMLSPDVLVESQPSDSWLRIVTASHPQSEAAQRLHRQLTAGGGLLRFASVLEQDGAVEAAGVGIDLDRYTTIYNMVTREASRRRGIARVIVETLLAMGRDSGGTHAVLQVTQENTAAQALYRGLGFEPVYRYRYLEYG